MNAIATQEWAGMLCGSMTKSGIRVSTAPGENGNTIDNEITSAYEPTAQSGENGENKKRFRSWCSCAMASLPLLRGERNARMTIFVQR